MDNDNIIKKLTKKVQEIESLPEITLVAGAAPVAMPVNDLNDPTNDSNNFQLFFTNIKGKLNEYKLYIAIGIAVLVIACIVYYFYDKNKKLTESTNKKEKFETVGNAPVLSLPKQQGAVAGTLQTPTIVAQPQQQLQQQQLQQQQLQQQQLQQQQMQQQQMQQQQMQQQQMQQQQMQQQMQQQQMQQQQLQQQQMQQQQMQQKSQQKPQEDSLDKIQLKYDDDDEDEEDNISENIAIVQAQLKENSNINQHNLTKEELAEIDRKLKTMQKSIS